jgi:hypothetical protein
VKDFGDLIGNNAGVLERLEAVGDAGGQVQHSPILSSEFDPEPLAKRLGILAYVQRDIEDASLDAGNQFHFRVRNGLEMYAAQGPASAVERNTALFDVVHEAVRAEFLPTEGACEEPALVFVGLRFDENDARDGCLGEAHV